MDNIEDKLNELHFDHTPYNLDNLFPPPTEGIPHVLRFELTIGCNWACTHCSDYKGMHHRIKGLEEYKNDVDEVFAKIDKNSPLAKRLTKIFIGNHALEVETPILKKAIQYTEHKFYECTGAFPKSVALYGRTDNILKQGVEGLSELAYGEGITTGLNLIYWGVESGSSKVLSYVRKGCSGEDVIKAAEIIGSVPINTSVKIMQGLGGKRFYKDHINKTAKVLGFIKPEVLTFIDANPASSSHYARYMDWEVHEHTNRPLNKLELAKQMVGIIKKMPYFKVKIGCFNGNSNHVGHNVLNFGSYDIYDKPSKHQLEEYLESELSILKANQKNGKGGFKLFGINFNFG